MLTKSLLPTRRCSSGPISPLIIGERINPTGRKLLSAEMTAGNFERVAADALAQVAAGAQMLDVDAVIHHHVGGKDRLADSLFERIRDGARHAGTDRHRHEGRVQRGAVRDPEKEIGSAADRVDTDLNCQTWLECHRTGGEAGNAAAEERRERRAARRVARATGPLRDLNGAIST